MVFICCVNGCVNSTKTLANESDRKAAFYGFPSTPSLCSRWLSLIGKPHWQLPLDARVCGLHFKPEDFVWDGETERLRDDAVPQCGLPTMSLQASQLGVCRVCLSSDLKMYSLQYGTLKKCMDYMAGYWKNFTSADMPQFLCYLCAAYLMKCCNFIETSQSAHDILLDILTENGSISKSLLKNRTESRTKCSVQSLQIHRVDRSSIIDYKYDETLKEEIRETSEVNKSTKDIEECIKEELDYKAEEPMLLDSIEDSKTDSEFDSEDEKALVHSAILNVQNAKGIFVLEQKFDESTKQPSKIKKRQVKKKGNEGIKKSKRKRVKRLGSDNLTPDEVQLAEHFNITRLTLEEQISEWKEINQRRSEGKKFTCEICSKSYSQQDAFQTHMTAHDLSRGPAQCPVCKLRYKTEAMVRSHLKCSHGRKYHCRTCLRTFNTQCMAKRHHKWHSGQVYRCGQCAFSTLHEALLSKHTRRRHPVRHACAICGHGFTGTAGLRLHAAKAHSGEQLDTESSEPFKCEECDLSFRTENARRVHLMTSFQHKKTRHMHEPSSEDPVRRRTCKVCGVVCGTLPALAAHIASLHPTARRNIEDYSVDCEYCGALVSSRKEHWAHIRQCHPTKRANYQPIVAAVCQTCGKGFPNTTKLQLHELRHSKPTVKCEVCHKMFYDKFRLSDHMSIHREAFPHRCKTCGRGFKAQANLARHYKTHTDIASYECTLCGKMFKYSTSLNLHVRSVHYKIPPPPRKKRTRSKHGGNVGASVAV